MRPAGDRIRAAFAALAWLGLAAPLAPAGEERLAAEWPQYHGPRRDNISTEKGLLASWPEGGPRLAWRFSECGGGFSTVAIADGRIFTAGDFGPDEFVLCLDLDGRPLWKTPNGRSWQQATPGARSTPTYDDGAVFQMNPTGRLAAFDARSGKERWAVDLKSTFDAAHGTWAMSESVAVEGDLVLCAPGGAKGRIVALDKRTGATRWVNTEIAERAAYCSPIVVDHGGVRQWIALMQRSIVGVDVKTGKTLWTHGHETPYGVNVLTPIYKDGLVYVSSGYEAGSRLLRLAPDGRSASLVWSGGELDNCHSGVLLIDGCVFGSGCRRNPRGLVCADLGTGKTLWMAPELGKVSLTYADGRFYALENKGKVSLLEADRKGWRIAGRFDLPGDPKQEPLAHPVVCGGRLFLRRWNELFAYDIARPSGG